MKKRIFLLMVAAYSVPLASNAGTLAGALDDWDFFGNGFVASVDDAHLVSEYPGSKGVMLVSRRAYDCAVSVRFEVLPLNPESVLVVMLASSDAGPESTLSLGDSYDGNVAHLLNSVDAYFFAMHNAAHNRTPFVRRHPYVRGESSDLDSADTNLMSTRWHTVEVSHDGAGHLRMSLDGETVLDTNDKEPLTAGNIALRLRGTQTHVATAMFRDITVSTCDSN